MELEIIGPPRPGPVTLVDWDPAWPERFEREAARIRSAVRDWADRQDYADAKGELVEAIIARAR